VPEVWAPFLRADVIKLAWILLSSGEYPNPSAESHPYYFVD